MIDGPSFTELIVALLPRLVELVVPLILGLVAFYLYRKVRKSGLGLISIAFFVETVPRLMHLMTFGNPYFLVWLFSLGYGEQEISLISLLFFMVRAAFHLTFLILTILGLIKLSESVSSGSSRSKPVLDTSDQRESLQNEVETP